MATPEIVDAAAWQAKLEELRVLEKELTRQGDRVSAQRRRLPMVEVTKPYTFEGEGGDFSLADLFAGHRQLIVYHFMFAPDAEAGCPGCSWVTDAMSHPAHLNARDATLVLVSRAPLNQLLAYRQRMGWDLPWYSSYESDFNYDFNATTDEGENHGVSVFLKQDDRVFRTYYTGNRGVEHLGSHWTWLDLTPFGRQEPWEDSPQGWPQSDDMNTKRHDEYE